MIWDKSEIESDFGAVKESAVDVNVSSLNSEWKASPWSDEYVDRYSESKSAYNVKASNVNEQLRQNIMKADKLRKWLIASLIICFIIPFIGIPIIIPFFILYHRHTNASRTFFKTEFIKFELNTQMEVLGYSTDKLYIQRHPITQDTKTASYNNLIDRLYIGRDKKWSLATVSDDITFCYRETHGRFLDLELEHNANKYTYTIFSGQVFIFPLKARIPNAVQYEHKPHTACESIRDFPRSFNKYMFNPQYNPFACMDQYEQTTLSGKKVIPYEDFVPPKLTQEEIQLHYRCIESQQFVESLIMLSKVLPHDTWIVRLQEDKLILIIGRKNNLFEMEKTYDETIAHFERDTREFDDIITAMTSTGHTKKDIIP